MRFAIWGRSKFLSISIGAVALFMLAWFGFTLGWVMTFGELPFLFSFFMKDASSLPKAFLVFVIGIFVIFLISYIGSFIAGLFAKRNWTRYLNTVEN